MIQLADTCACLVFALLFINRQLTCSALGCVKWTVYNNQQSTGSLQLDDYVSVSACQNYCIQNKQCVAVDFVSSTTRQCLVHTNVDNLAQRNAAADVTQYRIDRTCDAQVHTSTFTRLCEDRWKVRNNTNALGAETSDSFTVPDIETCLHECAEQASCVAVDVNVNAKPLSCWPHFRPKDLKDTNVFLQPGTNLYQLTDSCALNCIPQNITFNDANAYGATYYFNVTDVDECFNNCTSDLDCVAVDLNKNFNPFRCWPHFRDSDIVHANIYLQEGTTLFIPVKRCIASLYWAGASGAETTDTPTGGTIRPACARSTMILLLLLLLLTMMLL